MTEQLPLCLDKTIQAAFERFDAEHPDVFRYLVNQAFNVRDAGYGRYSIKTIFERARWHFHIEQRDPDFKLNNNFHSRYARKIMATYPELEGFFSTRELKAA